jgi:hypothetical protein
LDLELVFPFLEETKRNDKRGEFCRFSFERIAAWLKCKVHVTVKAVKNTCPSALPTGPQSELRYAVGLLSEYLSPEWAAHAVRMLGLEDVPVIAEKRVLSEVQQSRPQGVPPPVSEQKSKVRSPVLIEMAEEEATGF